MPEPSKSPDQVSDRRLEVPFDPAQADAADFFANIAYVSTANSDVTIVFGRQLEGLGGHSVTKVLSRITLSHSNFIFYGKVLGQHAEVLEKLYGGQLPDLKSAHERNPQNFQDNHVDIAPSSDNGGETSGG